MSEFSLGVGLVRLVDLISVIYDHYAHVNNVDLVCQGSVMFTKVSRLTIIEVS